MNKYELTKENLADFKAILSITESIDEHYQNLEKLELEGKKETEEYKRRVTFLKSTLSLEASLYEKYCNNIDKVLALMDYLIKNKNVAEGLNLAEALITKPIDFLYHRTMQKLNYFLLKSKEYARKVVPELAKYVLSTTTYENILVEQSDYNLLQTTIFSDLNRGTLTLLGRKINDQFIDEEEKDKLISSVYRFSFLKPEIEEILIKNNFLIPEIVYVSLDLIKTSINIQKEEVENILRKTYITSSTKLIADLLKIHDFNYNEFHFEHTSVIYSLLLRATLQFMDEETIMEVNDAFHEFIDSDAYLKDYSSDTKSIEIITNAFKSYKKDKQRIAKLTLKI